MTDTKHTPGPWARLSGFSDYIVADSPDGRIKRDICAVLSPDRWREDGEEEANALLIAAAPDLLAALKIASRYFHDNGGNDSYSWLPEIDAAIRKAEGGQE